MGEILREGARNPVNGLVKTGKTTVLTELLPQMILKQFPEAEICVLTFTDSWASKAIGLPAAGTETLDSLVGELQRSGRTIFFLIDEVALGQIPKWDALKGLCDGACLAEFPADDCQWVYPRQ